MLATGGYPGKYDTGKIIAGLAEADALPDVKVFHAGTKLEPRAAWSTDGGRVLGVTALGDDSGRRQGPGLRGGEANHFRRHALPHRHRRQGSSSMILTGRAA